MRKIIGLAVAVMLIFIVSEDGGTFAATGGCNHRHPERCPTPAPSPTATPPVVYWRYHCTAVPGCADFADPSVFEVPPAYRGRTDPLGGIVEQQTPGYAPQPDPSLWVINPPAPARNPAPWCVWDADDRVRGNFVGTLAPSQTISVTVCMISDTVPHRAGLTLVDYPQLTGSITFGEHMTMSVAGGRSGCIVGAQYKMLSDSRLSPIANTNYPAVGRYQSVTFSVTNPTAVPVSIIVPTTLGRYLDGHSGTNFPESRWCPGDMADAGGPAIWQYGNWLFAPLDVSLGIQPGVWWAN